eukprot:363984-Chlamydomonas_euryale.AAC.2
MAQPIPCVWDMCMGRGVRAPRLVFSAREAFPRSQPLNVIALALEQLRALGSQRPFQPVFDFHAYRGSLPNPCTFTPMLATPAPPDTRGWTKHVPLSNIAPLMNIVGLRPAPTLQGFAHTPPPPRTSSKPLPPASGPGARLLPTGVVTDGHTSVHGGPRIRHGATSVVGARRGVRPAELWCARAQRALPGRRRRACVRKELRAAVAGRQQGARTCVRAVGRARGWRQPGGLGGGPCVWWGGLGGERKGGGACAHPTGRRKDSGACAYAC